MNDLIKFWQELDTNPNKGCYIHPDEKIILKSYKDPFFKGEDKDNYNKTTDNKKLHIDLLPSPYMGDIRNAKVYILMNNPGIGQQDKEKKHFLGEYDDHANPALWRALSATLKQDFNCEELSEYKFLFLNPIFQNTSGGRYIIRKLNKCISLYDQLKQNNSDGLKVFSNNICFLQMYPYHSGNNPEKFQNNCKSHLMAMDYYKNLLEPLCYKEDILILVVRGHSHVIDWLPDNKQVGYYYKINGASNRAHFSLENDGCYGRRIVDHLLKFGCLD